MQTKWKLERNLDKRIHVAVVIGVFDGILEQHLSQHVRKNASMFKICQLNVSIKTENSRKLFAIVSLYEKVNQS